MIGRYPGYSTSSSIPAPMARTLGAAEVSGRPDVQSGQEQRTSDRTLLDARCDVEPGCASRLQQQTCGASFGRQRPPPQRQRVNHCCPASRA